MSDFIFSSKPKQKGEFTKHIHSIYHSDPPEVLEYHGDWGSLGVSRNLYNGFQPLETDNLIFVVIGGPVLYFRDNSFLMGSDPTEGTRAIYERWLSRKMEWDEDLSGLFAILLIDKNKSRVFCITDLLMFITVYQYLTKEKLMLGTHVDALAKAAGISKNIDLVSVADFILNDAVTYPYTVYKEIKQLHPASVQKYDIVNNKSNSMKPEIYWIPEEKNIFRNIDEAAEYLQKGVQEYVDRVTAGMSKVAQFISAGEDSRAISGIIPNHLQRDAYIFLDSMNREGRIAQKVAAAYGANFKPNYRSKTFYLDILEEGTDLIGNGVQYTHAHTFKFHKQCNLQDYPAVLGGYLSDNLLKALYSKTKGGKGRFSFLPQFYIPGETRSIPQQSPLFKKEILEEIDSRRKSHLDYVKTFRSKSLHEWFIWPNMRPGAPNLYCNRRLFRTYEPFLCKESLKTSAAVPIYWKLNRRLFFKAFRDYLKPSKRIFHADGRLPYYPWWFNMPLQFTVWISRKFGSKLGLIKGNQGPWGDWYYMIKSPKMDSLKEKYSEGKEELFTILKGYNICSLFESNSLSVINKINLLQVLFFLNSQRIEP